MLKISLALPKYRVSLTQLIGDIKNGLQELDPLLSEIRAFNVSHHGKVGQLSSPTQLETSSQDFVAGIELDRQAVLKTHSERFCISVLEFCENTLSQKKKYFLRVNREIGDATDSGVSIKDQNWGDAYLDLLEKIPIHFDDEGKYKLQATGNPKTLELIASNPLTEEQMLKKRALIEEKKRKFYQQKRSRRLS